MCNRLKLTFFNYNIYVANILNGVIQSNLEMENFFIGLIPVFLWPAGSTFTDMEIKIPNYHLL